MFDVPFKFKLYFHAGQWNVGQQVCAIILQSFLSTFSQIVFNKKINLYEKLNCFLFLFNSMVSLSAIFWNNLSTRSRDH